MSPILRFVVILICILFLLFVARLVAKEKLLLKYSLIWMLLTILTLFCSIFPKPILLLAALLGFETPSNFIFLIGFFFLLAITLSLSAIVSKQSLQIKNLIQTAAFLEKADKESKKELL